MQVEKPVESYCLEKWAEMQGVIREVAMESSVRALGATARLADSRVGSYWHILCLQAWASTSSSRC